MTELGGRAGEGLGGVAWQYVSSPVRINVDKGPYDSFISENTREHRGFLSVTKLLVKAAGTIVEI